ncbi:hypothetical protein NQ314_013504 [Rhamnusium bicolor]|uniref:Peptidase S1 domain-containing protein n=1 Tax=Rhamnusium bicolor TaxID=1586634 RepID=A0AAV8X5L4_9CUCU|nr:hypothetical protein NQ314_013504 [Rhamnusium bicolor]
MGPVLKKAKIPFAQKENCNARNTNSRSLIEGQICAGRQNSTDSCNGDSGGPVMLEVNFNFEFVTHLVGIISYGFGECGNGPSVSTFVPYYIDWINDNIR